MRHRQGWYALLIAPFAGTLFPWIYNRQTPELFGLPFFYWYQLGWVVVTAALLGLVVYLTRGRDDV
ncbi:MAG TPA: DUF3311 domain-containing protein [Candidatus Tumulicola sp.]